MDFVSLDQIFNNRVFRIPDYQRGYAWRSEEDKEVVAFWNDLINLPDNMSHFTGSLTLQEIPEGERNSLGNDIWLMDLGYEPWYVVDGQQRLTTITILMQCISEFLDKLPEVQLFMNQTVGEIKRAIQDKYISRYNRSELHRSYLFGYSNNQVSDKYLRRIVFNDINVSICEESYYTLNIKNAKAFFQNNIEKLYKNHNNDSSIIESVYRKLTQKLKFQLIEVKKGDDFNIFVAFETINNRGRQLSNLEKLKNRLIYLTTLYGSGSVIRGEINDAWAEIYHQLGRNYNPSSTGKVVVLDDDDFLKTHWILYFQYSRKTGSDYVNYLFGNKFTVQNVFQYLAKPESTQIIVHDEDDEYDDEMVPDTNKSFSKSSLSLKEIQGYARDLKNTAEMWYYTWFPSDAKDRLDADEIEWMQRINRIGIAYFRPLITALFFERLINKRVSKEESLKLLIAIERFIFIEFRLQTTRSHYGSSEFSIVARELHNGSKKVQNILRMIEERIDRSFEIDESTGLKYFKTRNMQVMVDKLFEQKEDERAGYYRWSAIHYFLYEYNANLKTEGYHGSSVTWDSFKQSQKDRISIEHIFPHKVEDSSYWARVFNAVSKEMWPIYQGSLGNLLLLSQKINAELQNDDFETKKCGRQTADENKCRGGYKKGSFSELEVADKKDWTPEEIKKRGLKMMEFMENHWNFKFKSEEDKQALLFPKSERVSFSKEKE